MKETEEKRVQLPELPTLTRRQLTLKWEGLLRGYKFDGNQVTRLTTKRKCLSHAREAARVINEAGVMESRAVAVGHFQNLATAYRGLWNPTSGYEVFKGWVEILGAQTLDQVAALWKGKSSEIDVWFEEACQPCIRRAIGDQIAQSVRKAGDAELSFLSHVRFRLMQQSDQAATQTQSFAGIENGAPPYPLEARFVVQSGQELDGRPNASTDPGSVTRSEERMKQRSQQPVPPEDIAQVCRNGHIAVGSITQFPSLGRAFCEDCGEPTLSECPNCRWPIRGIGRNQWKIGPYVLPKYCVCCGSAFPWASASAANTIRQSPEQSDIGERASP